MQAIPQDIFEESTTQQADLGAKAVMSNGDVYRYVKVGGTALVAGKLFDGPANVANHSNIAVAAAAASGVTSITVTLGATLASANQYAGGKVVVNDVDGQGFTYDIKSHPAADLSTALVVTLEANTPIETALTTSSQVTLVPNQYNGVIIHAATETGVPVGVARTNVTASSFSWIQTRGVVSILQDNAAAALGKSAAASTTTDGSVTAGTGALKEVGTMLETGVSTEYNSVFMEMD